MTYTTLFFDLDDTLYSQSCGLWPAIGKRIDLYIRNNFNIPEDQINSYRINLYKKYGTTLRGLKHIYGINEDDYLDFVHDVPLEDYINYDSRLRNILNSYSQDKWIFTNADDRHAKRVLNVLRISDCFTGIIDIKKISPYCKPQTEAYNIALNIVGLTNPKECVFIDDRDVNLDPAKEIGFYTILIDQNNTSNNHHTHIQSLLELPSVLKNTNY